MFTAQPRKTSIPIHFHFAQSKRSSTKDTRCILPASLRPKKRPASIIVPHDTPDHRRLPDAVQPEWTPVEIANFPPQLRRADFLGLLKEYNIAPEFAFPLAPRFTHPFRTTILATSVGEARRMVKELNNKSVTGRNISVRIIVDIEKEDQEVCVQDVADKLKTNIINTARMYYSTLTDAILEVRELVKDESLFVFLQKRGSVTVYSSPHQHALSTQNKADWEFIAGASVELDLEDGQLIPILDALKGMQENVERQGVLGQIWGEWDGSRVWVVNAL